jgi:phosphotransferase system IIA component
LTDDAYLGHMANDAVACQSAEFQQNYERDSLARANAEIIPFDVAEVDDAGYNLVLHYAQRALKPIKAGEEVFLHYGFDYWQLNA